MESGFRGMFVIPWSATTLDFEPAGPVTSLRPGQCWRWSGEPFRIDGPANILPLGDATGSADLRRRAARSVRRLFPSGPAHAAPPPLADDDHPSFTVTDGRKVWSPTLIPTGPDRPPLVQFDGHLPPRNTDLWVISATGLPALQADPAASVICFTPGTLIRTPAGLIPVEQTTQGTLLQTKDNGPQPVLWTGRCRVSGARLHAMPHLAPIRLRHGALDNAIPDPGLLVSPGHRILLQGIRARALFSADEVLVTAGDLVNDSTILTDRTLKEVTYIHLLLPQHEILFANGVECDSFHPARAGLSTMDAAEQASLLALFPRIATDPHSYGPPARRMLNRSEAAILRHPRA
jgi:hypothetical protein